MSIGYQVLGQPGCDNSVIVRIDTGKSITRLLFDCGEDCLDTLTFAEILNVDHLLFSHQHMDHVSGFDSYFRANYSRTDKPNFIWGPPGTARIMSHRFRGYWWNLHETMTGSWLVCDIHPNEIHTSRFELSEAFEICHNDGLRPHAGRIMESSEFSVDIFILNHNGPCIAYKVTEKPKVNIQTDRLSQLGMKPGAWLQRLKDPNESGSIEINQVEYPLEELRQKLIVESPGDSFAYVTDFRVEPDSVPELSDWLRGTKTLVCEAQYRQDDMDLARKNYHMTTHHVAELANQAQVEKLVLFHLSSRYRPEVWQEMLMECKSIFPKTEFPAQWGISA